MDKINQTGRKKLKIVFMGTPSFACESLKQIYEHFEIVAVVTSPDQPAGRGLKIQSSEIKKLALNLNLPILTPISLKDEFFLKELASFNADVFVVVAFKMLPNEVWKMPKMGTINLHASLLPQYRGAAPINWAIIKGEKKTGLTTFFIEEKMDTGLVLAQTEIPIELQDNAGTLHDKMAIEGAALLVQTLEKLAQDTLYPIAQKELEIGKTLKKAPKIFKETGEIDFNQEAQTVNNLIRGLSPYPGAWCLGVFNPKDQSENKTVFAKNKPFLIKILSAEIVAESLLPGEIKTDNKHYLIIGCKEKALKIQEIQVEGRKKCKSDEFLRGCQAFSLKIVQNEKK